MDAVRISDNKQVTMKLITSEHHPDEVNIWRYLTSEPLASDPHNHCVPLYEVLDVPDQPGRQLLIMPLLRQCTDPRFDKVEEVMDMATQFFEVRNLLAFSVYIGAQVSPGSTIHAQAWRCSQVFIL